MLCTAFERRNHQDTKDTKDFIEGRTAKTQRAQRPLLFVGVCTAETRRAQRPLLLVLSALSASPRCIINPGGFLKCGMAHVSPTCGRVWQFFRRGQLRLKDVEQYWAVRPLAGGLAGAIIVLDRADLPSIEGFRDMRKEI